MTDDDVTEPAWPPAWFGSFDGPPGMSTDDGIDLDAFRRSCARQDVPELCDAIERLRAERKSAVEEAWDWHDKYLTLRAEHAALAAHDEAVRALHSPAGTDSDGNQICQECVSYVGEYAANWDAPWPCDTIKALDI